MADKSKIAWCDATIGPAYGCSPVSPACDNCYASRMAHRLGKLTEGTHKDGRWTGKINLFPERTEQALRWRRPRRIFLGSMTDLFHENVPDEFLDKVFAYMALASQHTFILLTKRPKRMLDYISRLWVAGWVRRLQHALPDGMPYHDISGRRSPVENIWLGVTAENQAMADERTPFLLDTPAAKRFVSIEPMLGPVGLDAYLRCQGCGYTERDKREQMDHHLCTNKTAVLDWVICGCESGPRSRGMMSFWARSLKDQCVSAGVPFFFKQAMQDGKLVHTPELDGQTWTQFPEVRP